MNATPLIQGESPVLSDPAPTARDDVPSPAESPLTTPSEVLPLDEIEKRHILAALRHTNANRTRAATLLGISIRTLRNKLQEYRAAGIVIEGDESPGE
jgi:DNA-binding NtrC family response regulator